MRKILISLLLIISLLTAFIIPASAAVVDPSDFGDYVVSGDIIIYNISNQFDLFYWRRLHDGSLSGTGTGKHFVYSTQMRYVDNDQIFLYPFGYNSSFANAEFVDLNSYPLGSAISFKADFELSIPASTQSYGTDLRIYWQFFDENKNSLGFNSKAYPIEKGQQLRIYQIDETFSTTNPNARYFSCYLLWDFSDVANESDTTSVQVDTNTYTLSISFPVDRLGQLIDQGKLTNQQLSDIDQALQDNGQKLDDVVAGNQQIHDDINNAVNGTIPPADVPAGNDKIDDLDNQEGQLRDDAADGLQQGLDMMDDTLDALFTYSFGFFALGMIFELFFQIPFFNVLVSLALVLGILASFLGILVDISGKDDSITGRIGKYSRKKPGGKYTKSAARARAKARSKGGKS